MAHIGLKKLRNILLYLSGSGIFIIAILILILILSPVGFEKRGVAKTEKIGFENFDKDNFENKPIYVAHSHTMPNPLASGYIEKISIFETE
jgi:hypothetical protein